jgi:hypothetical protein
MHICGSVYRAVEHVSAGKAAAIGGAGSGVSIMSATLADPTVIAWLDPSDLVPWLQVATLSVGFVTGLGSFGLVFLKYLQRWRAKKPQG